MDTKDIIERYNDYQIEMRRYFHQNPEISCQEYGTSQKIKEELDKNGVPWETCGFETGVLATIKGGKAGKTFLIRGDIDALAVTEETGVPYASRNEGVMHACGHDCHTSMLLTATRILNDIKDEISGTIKIAFQPAEELAIGAKEMISKGAMNGVDGCFAIHVWSDTPAGKFCIMSGPMMASADMFKINVVGRGGHGAQPENCIDAALVSAEIVNSLQTIVSREFSPLDPVVVTIGRISAGTRWNVIAEQGYLEGTTRCFSKEIYEQLPEKIERIATETAKAYRAEAQVEYTKLIRPTINDESVVEIVKGSVQKILGEDCIVNGKPTTAGEDFSRFIEEAQGAIGFLGVGNENCGAIWPQHSNKFCVDETVLIKGAMIYVQVAIDFLSKSDI